MTQIKAIISNIANKKRTVLTIQETKLLGREELAIEKNSKIPAGAGASAYIFSFKNYRYGFFSLSPRSYSSVSLLEGR